MSQLLDDPGHIGTGYPGLSDLPVAVDRSQQSAAVDMRLLNPSPAVVASVHAAASWFKKTALYDIAFKSAGGDGRHLISDPGAGPTWARYYEIGTDRPIFGDRDKTIHDNVDEISRERRVGYSWYKDTGKRALQHYTKWAKAHPAS